MANCFRQQAGSGLMSSVKVQSISQTACSFSSTTGPSGIEAYRRIPHCDEGKNQLRRSDDVRIEIDVAVFA
jgi:hypothetical protein